MDVKYGWKNRLKYGWVKGIVKNDGWMDGWRERFVKDGWTCKGSMDRCWVEGIVKNDGWRERFVKDGWICKGELIDGWVKGIAYESREGGICERWMDLKWKG